jgi:hypothetical protein
MIIALWRILAFFVWFGVMFAICTVVIAVALAAALLAVVYGLASPSRTPASCLLSLWLNARQAVIEVDALRPS